MCIVSAFFVALTRSEARRQQQQESLTSRAEIVVGAAPVTSICHESGTDAVRVTRWQLAPVLVSRSRHREHPDHPTEHSGNPK